MQNTKIVAIAAVILILIAGIAGAALILGEDSPSYRSDNETGRLMIYGNANNDDYLDESDVTALETIIESGTWDENKAPLADANQDGVIDEKDVEMVKKMVNREPMDIYYQGWDFKTPAVKKVGYPIKTCVVTGSNALMAVKSIGATDRIVGASISTSTLDKVLYSDIYDNVPDVSKNSIITIVPEEFSKVNDKTPVDAIITMNSVSYVKNEETFLKSGVDVVRVAASDGLDSISAYITLGFLLECEERANDFARFCDDLIGDVEEKLDGVERKTSLSVTMTNSVSGLGSDYAEAVALAGGKDIADWDGSRNFKTGEEWLYEYPSQYIMHVRSMGLGDVDKQKEWDTRAVYFKNTAAYKDGHYYLINGSMPVALRIAYMAETFNPDIFGNGFGDKYMQEYLDRFMDNLSGKYDVKTQLTSVISIDEVKG